MAEFFRYHIGIDDTDSSEGMCTTFLTFNLVSQLVKLGELRHFEFTDYPNLIRLNPNIPWKTRGNASLVIRIGTDLEAEDIFRLSQELVQRFSTSDRANSGLILLRGETIPPKVGEFSNRALYDVLSVKQAKDLISEFGMLSFGLRSAQGLVGALAGIGNTLRGDHTFELIAYRKDCTRPRTLEKERVAKMSRMTFPDTFNSYDEENKRILIAPHGPDPVLLGIRGETSKSVSDAFGSLEPLDNLLGWMIFRSNQGTGEHLNQTLDANNLKSYTSGKMVGTVASRPKVERGGHVFFSIRNSTGDLTCACYEPAKKLRMKVLALMLGDEVEVGGGVRKPTSRHPRVLNLEYLRALKLVEECVRTQNPPCPWCGTAVSSAGRNQGLRCPKCGATLSGVEKYHVPVPRQLEEALYLPPSSAQRHLTKPMQRYSAREKARLTHPPSDLGEWFRRF